MKLTDCEFTGVLKSSYKEEGGSSTEFTDFLNDGMVGGQRKGETADMAIIIGSKVFFEGALLQNSNMKDIPEGADIYMYKTCQVKSAITLPNANHLLPGASLTVSNNAALTITGAMAIYQGATLSV